MIGHLAINRRGWAACALSGLLAGTLAAGCDNGPSAVETRDRTAEAPATASGSASADAPPETALADAPAPAPERARWSANRRSTAEENIQRLYERNGAAFGARSADDYVDQAHAFIADPPAGVETVRRANGDTLYYHAAGNTFLVATRDGVPRTMFKPDDGAAYWALQKTREAERGG